AAAGQGDPGVGERMVLRRLGAEERRPDRGDRGPGVEQLADRNVEDDLEGLADRAAGEEEHQEGDARDGLPLDPGRDREREEREEEDPDPAAGEDRSGDAQVGRPPALFEVGLERPEQKPRNPGY